MLCLLAFAACSHPLHDDPPSITPLDPTPAPAPPAPSTPLSSTPPGPRPPPPDVEGTVGGHPFALAAAIAFPKTFSAGPGYEIVLADKPLECGGVVPVGATTIRADILGDPPPSQIYHVTDASSTTPTATTMTAVIEVRDSACNVVYRDGSFVGTFGIGPLASSSIDGLGAMSFGTNPMALDGSVEGKFHATVCDSSTAGITCEPR